MGIKESASVKFSIITVCLNSEKTIRKTIDSILLQDYDKREYIDFKNEIKNIAKMNDAYFLDFENIIPAKYWGSKASTAIDNDLEIDFMHFQFKGHKILADTLLMHINSTLSLR
tara:strand:- start:1226 stop:1567 length:342 start_codon:yes stop_codon:yes gene_type:complete